MFDVQNHPWTYEPILNRPQDPVANTSYRLLPRFDQNLVDSNV